MRLVTDGEKFAVKRGYLCFARYLDIKGAGIWWIVPEFIEKYAWGTKEQAISVMEKEKAERFKVRKNWKVRD